MPPIAVAAQPSIANGETANQALQVFSTCPSSSATSDNYLRRVADAARWSESAGCAGMLIYTDNSLVDPWLVSHVVIQNTRSLSPLVAVQPVLMHPYAVAKIVSTLGFLHGRRVFLNMVAGGFKNDLAAINDMTPHDKRYERLVEYTLVIRSLLEGGPVTFAGQFYQVTNLTLKPHLCAELRPGIFMSGSSPAGLAAAKETGAVAVQYPEPPGKHQAITSREAGQRGIRVGIVTRPDEEEAWRVAWARFPGDRGGQLTRQLANKVSDSVWHHTLSELGKTSSPEDSPGLPHTYWLHPFENYQTNCPYLVGSYENVAREVAGYLELGHRTFILDIPPAEEELEHARSAIQLASRGMGL